MADVDEAVSPRQKTMEQAIQSLGPMNNGLDSLDMRADPDAQATVTDFLDFTEYLPSDMIRSLTLIGQLDKSYIDASSKLHNLTTDWGQLPNVPPEERRQTPVQLRADISESLNFAVSSRIYSHAEATRMAENVNRHYNRLRTIHAKLKTMLETYPTEEEQRSPVRSPQATRNTKITLRVSGGDQKARRLRVPRITVPGEVLAPYDLEYDAYSDDSESSIEDEDEDEEPTRRTPGPRSGTQQPKIKMTIKNPKTPKQRVHKFSDTMVTPGQPAHTPLASASTVLKQLKPPPDDAVPGSEDAPWMQLTAYELARLRKRMKKNSAWVPSETMIARELKNLGRGWDAFSAAKQKAEEEGKPFDSTLPVPIIDAASGTAHPPMGAITVDAAIAEENRINRGSELNKAKKLKREALAKLAAEEAEASARKMAEAAAMFLHGQTQSANHAAPEQTPSKTPSKTRQRKRKRDSVPEAEAEKPDNGESSASSSQRPPLKRTKTETPVPVPVPQLTPAPSSNSLQEPHASTRQVTPGGTVVVPQSTTPVPVPIPGGQDQSNIATKTSVSPTSTNGAAPSTVTTTVPVKLPGETPIPPPVVAPVQPSMRETRSRDAKKEQIKEKPAAPVIKQSASRAATPARTTPGPDAYRRPGSRGKAATPAPETGRRPASRGKAASQEPLPSLAADRPRRASTARNTPAPEARQPSKRVKRPAPGVISRTNSGGNSAVGKRKAAPKKKSRQKRDKGQAVETEVEIEVDDEGNVVDPDEPKYCLCNRVSYGTMIQCDNNDCKQEWFHLECVGLSAIPARTTKWYCPECRVLLNIGEKGEVSARGVRA
ncbi:Inhibitor of growth protein 1 [Pleurostoma richardsiae]|uniref:Inhibitor of growth protein 1 n=1 Tax=Pleurostoma richardsiae TaxID=41990 RepID=A0AA38S2U2_9PEZI|nr:Inhibitor of growth protein 1 [Pleurostoma richardsiae]